MTETYLESYQTAKMKFFCEIVNSFQLLIFLKESSLLDVWQGSQYASECHQSGTYSLSLLSLWKELEGAYYPTGAEWLK